MKNFLKLLGGFALGLVATAALATTTIQDGWNPTTGLNGVLGLQQSIGTPPATTGTTCSSGTAVATGGPIAGIVTTATCTTGFIGVLVWTIPSLGAGGVTTAPAGSGYSQAVFAPTINGGVCNLTDITTGADNTIANTTAIAVYVAPTATAAGTITCTFATKTIVAGDILTYTIDLF